MNQHDVSFNTETQNFELFDKDNGTRVAEFIYGHAWAPIPSEDGCMLQLWSTALPESQVIQLTSIANASNTVGWLCTVSALTSTEHEYSKNSFFRKAAGHAVHKLLEDIAVQNTIDNSIESSTIDIFPESACVLIVLKNLLPTEIGNQPSKLHPQLHQFSFSPYSFGQNRTHCAGKHAIEMLSPDGVPIKKIQLKGLPGEVPFFNFIDTLLCDQLSNTQDPPYRFFLYYQILELLMEKVQYHKQKEFVSQLNSSINDTTVLYDLIHNLGKKTDEKSRIVALFYEYSKISNDMITGLQIECEVFLKLMNKEEAELNCGKALYKVRNMLIHNMRRIPAQGNDSLNLINDYLEVIVPSLLITFKYPESLDTFDYMI